MPELSRFEGMIIKMLFNDTDNTTSHMYMFTMVNIKLPLLLMANY